MACSPPAGSPRSLGGPSSRSRASPSTMCRSRTDCWRRCAGWRTTWRCRSARCCWQRTPRCSRALTGEREVVTGYVAGRVAEPLPCRLTTEPESWRTLLQDVHRVESELLSYRDFPVDDLRRELGLTEPLFETVFDPTGDGGDLAEDTVLEVAISQHGEPARAAAALPDRRARRRLRCQDRRLPPRRARADRRRSGCRAPAAEPAVGRGDPASSSMGSPDLAGSCRTAVCTSCSSSGWRPTRMPSPPCTATGSGPTGSSTPVPTGWDEPCWRAVCPARVSSPW